MRRMRSRYPLLIILLVSGCAAVLADNRREASSGAIGCSPDVIQVESTGNYSWTATCKGKVYYCSSGGQGVQCTAAD